MKMKWYQRNWVGGSWGFYEYETLVGMLLWKWWMWLLLLGMGFCVYQDTDRWSREAYRTVYFEEAP